MRITRPYRMDGPSLPGSDIDQLPSRAAGEPACTSNGTSTNSLPRESYSVTERTSGSPLIVHRALRARDGSPWTSAPAAFSPTAVANVNRCVLLLLRRLNASPDI